MSKTNQKGSHLGALLTPELINAISELFPRSPINIKHSDREIWHTEGQCSVVDVLQAKYDEVNQNILSKRVI